MNGDVQSDLSTLASNNREQLEYFHGKILRLQQEIMISGEIVSPTRLIFQYMKALSKRDKLGAFIAPKMTDIITLPDNNWKSAVYTGGDIHGIYYYLEIIGDPTVLTTSSQRYHHFSPPSSINNYVATLQPVIADLRTRQKIICELCGRIGNKADVCIIRDPKFLPPSLRRKVNQFNSLHGDETNEPPRDFNIQTPAAHFKYSTSPSKSNPVISAIMGRLNHHAIDNGNVKVSASYFPFDSNSESVQDPDTTPIKSIYGEEMDNLL